MPPDLSRLPSVDEVLASLRPQAPHVPHQVLAGEIRRVLDGFRAAARLGEEPDLARIPEQVRAAIARLERPSFRRVINATGVILHTNLGRAPLAAATLPAGYSNLEYDLASGRRGKRDVHIAGLLERLFDRPGIAVNNNEAAVYLALNELAAGGEVIVSRGELIEIGDGFRIPDVMRRAGVELREVGATNRTHIDDYREAITDRTRLLLRVHPSNFRIEGFTARPELRELSALARERGLPLYEDLGSGCLMDLRPLGIEEPLVTDSLRDGADLVSFSGDKLIGGPQAGVLVGRPELIARLRRNPMFRALRLDKLIYQVLESTLRDLLLERYDRIPALAMLCAKPEEIRRRAEALLASAAGVKADLIDGWSVVGGGSTPAQKLPTCLIALAAPSAAACERKLRAGDPPVIARIENERVVLDLRTVFPEEEAALAAALQALSW